MTESDSNEDHDVRRLRLPGFIVKEEIGLGDALKYVTELAGIAPCGGCQRRAAQFNRRVTLYSRSSSIAGHSSWHA